MYDELHGREIKDLRNNFLKINSRRNIGRAR